MSSKSLDDIINNPNFGSLARLTVIVIMAVGFIVASTIVILRGGDINAYVDAAQVFGTFAISAISGGLATTFGKSETAKYILAQKSIETTPEQDVYYGVDGTTLPTNLPNSDEVS